MSSTITYDGVATEIEPGKTATLVCGGKVTKSDIVMSFESDGTITYDGVTTEVEGGKTATLACAGKLMKSDVAMYSEESGYSFVYNLVGCTGVASNPTVIPKDGTEVCFTIADGYDFWGVDVDVQCSGSCGYLVYYHEDNLDEPDDQLRIIFYDVGSLQSDVTITINPVRVYDDCIMFRGEEGDFDLRARNNHNGTMQYSTDHSTWATWTGSFTGKMLYLRGSGITQFYDGDGSFRILILSGKAACYGNIQTLIDYKSPPTTTVQMNSFFYDSTGLTKAPDLPATTLAVGAYANMFYGCTSLVKAPKLPATTLADSCYRSMFFGCTALAKAPELPATTLTDLCYYGMFVSCEKIRLSATKTGNYTQAYRIPTAGTGTEGRDSLLSMFSRTGGTFTSSPSINTTYYMDVSG